MNNLKPFIHTFKTHKGCYVYDVNTSKILKIDEKYYDMINNNEVDNVNDNIIQDIRNKGFLSSHRLSEIEHPESEVLEYILNSQIQMITLQVTQQCNLRCKYCPYSGGYENRKHANKKMNFETAKKSIDFLINHSMDYETVSIGFYGGEPLLEFELIKECIEYTKKIREGKEIIFSITTNGTLLTEENVEFLCNNNVMLIISLDGPKNIHDKNRDLCNGKGSFEKVIENVEMVKKKFPKYFEQIAFNCVLDPENDFGCIDKFFTNFDTVKNSLISFSQLNTTYSKDDNKVDDEEYICNYNYEVFKLFLSKLGRLDKSEVSKIVSEYYSNLINKMHKKRYASKLSSKGHHGGPCVPGAQRLFVDIYGSLYPCEKCSEESEVMKIGNIFEGFDIDKARNLLNIGKITEEQCKNCWAYKFCYLCAVVADDLTALSANKKMEYCKGVKVSIDDMLKDYCALKELGDDFDEKLLVQYF